MRCPFLREAQVKSCGASEFKKMIVRIPTAGGNTTDERCSSTEYVSCPWVKQRNEELPNQARCPFLQESLAQYCAGASVVKYVPYSDPGLSRCGTSNHRYCELFLLLSHPNLLTFHEVDAPTLNSEDEGPWIVDGIQTTGWHLYSHNHMWAEVDEEGTYHLGLDPFFAKVIGRIEKLTFIGTSGRHQAGVVITVKGIDLPITFPNHINVKTINSHLRTEPDRIISEPYTFGWLFEGTNTQMPGETDVKHGLVHGRDARTWMQNETTRLSDLVHKKFVGVSENQTRLAADGGIVSDDLSGTLNREQLLFLYNEFFLSRQ